MATKGINTYKLAQIENILKIYINFKNGEGCLCNKYDNMIFVIKVLQPKPRKFPFFFAFYIEYIFFNAKGG